ncbi:uncharacterized protein F4807DRAFT_110383 [Annulohypoxylon truncatum]|uniref:uncharacterized protein n=1 Tax=Annulohypoxylon truncatum TaxID=327061 RepID=UPI002007B477|nr:uncharacterized protein F4807DRAFT_110383 [Annulohypoxylon truncatum]KAI1209109.1 hypothetical protein F4807DRAFT_110383 [Annulohypoxylon truncatum]
MDSFTLTNLPTELISQICNILCHTHPPSLLNFARSNRTCYTIAAAFLSHTIWIFAAEPVDLITTVQEHLKSLHRLGVFGSVRRLVIYGPGVDCPNRAVSPDFPTPVPVVDLEGRFNNPQPSVYLIDKSPVTRVYEADDRWLPLVGLIQQLPALTDLIYQCPGQFPPCLLQALHQHRPECRLHIDNFRLRSILPDPPIADPHEFLIATSPCLYSISMAVDYTYNSLPSHHVGAVLRLVTGLAPNLKEVHLFRSKIRVWKQDQEHSSFLPHWRDLPIFKACPRILGSLSCLQLWGHIDEPSIVTEHVLADWSMHTDFTVLRTLRINSMIDENALSNLVNGSHNFQSLETLVLTLSEPGGFYIENLVRYCRLVEDLIGNLRGLHTLEIIGWTSIIDISTKLSSKLRALTLWSCKDEYLSIQDVTNIRERCPFLESLKMAVCRTKGDANETALYRELGTFPKLKKLALKMCAPFPFHNYGDILPPTSDFDDFDRERFPGSGYLKGHIRDVFINSAMDGTLARSIFETVSMVKESHSFVMLEKLKIRYEPSPDFCLGHKFRYLGKYGIPLCGSWQVDRSLRDDSRHVLLAREFDKKDREEEEGIHDQFKRIFSEIPRADPVELESVFRRLWPERWEGSDWWDDWHSFPLSTSS